MILTLEPHLETGGFHTDRFDASLDGEHVVTSRQPLVDGARELLKRGFLPDEELGAQHAGSDHVALLPRPIGELAKWTYSEGRSGLHRMRWAPFDRKAILGHA